MSGHEEARTVAGRQGIVRIDRYTIEVDGHRVRATEDQERRLAAMLPEQRARFVAVMGGS